nr:MAG: putative RNA-dependent RNA polymerase [Narnaviridae sp.]
MNLHCKSDELIHHLYQQMKKIKQPDQWVSVFKVSLASYFSKNMNQELPEDSHLAINLIPLRFERLLRKRWSKPRRKVRELWNLLQAKRLAAAVPRQMIQKAYSKHGDVLSTIGNTPSDVITSFKLNVRDFLEKVQIEYKEIIPLAPSKAYFGKSRDLGGCFSALKSLYSRGLSRQNPRLVGTRLDPPLIYLLGKPGIGKSHLCNGIVKCIGKRFSEEVNTVYWRNFSSDFFDGYTGQLIYGIDDAFQSRGTLTNHCSEVDDLIQIKSNNEFKPNMADLRDKGRNFISEFVLLSSNIAPDNVCNIVPHINCPDALRRRLEHYWQIHEHDFQKGIFRYSLMKVNDRTTTAGEPPTQIRYFESTRSILINNVCDFAIHQHGLAANHALSSIDLSPNWRIPILPHKFDQSNLAYEFPSSLPQENKVAAFAIPEPLKVRMITKEQPLSWALKPLQKAMARSLSQYSCFHTGFKGTIEEFVNKNLDKGQYILSGDYASATDNLHKDIMDTFVDQFCDVFRCHPNLCNYVRFFGGQHTIQYPKWTGLGDVIQRNGQLMGSLLSFPILCIANATTRTHQKKCSLSELKACINGDDILFTDNIRGIRSWKRIASSMGLKPSIGKNFCSPFWGTFNSQLIYRRSREDDYQFIQTGKSGLVCRKDTPLVTLALKEGFSKSQIVSWGRSALLRTPESIDISTDYGGLGLENTISPSRQVKEVYLFKLTRLMKKCSRPMRLNDSMSIMCVPLFISKQLKHLTLNHRDSLDILRTFQNSQLDSLIPDELPSQAFPFKDFISYRNGLRKNKVLRTFIRDKSVQLHNLPPLPLFKPSWIIVMNSDVAFIENQSERLMHKTFNVKGYSWFG